MNKKKTNKEWHRKKGEKKEELRTEWLVGREKKDRAQTNAHKQPTSKLV